MRRGCAQPAPAPGHLQRPNEVSMAGAVIPCNMSSCSITAILPSLSSKTDMQACSAILQKQCCTRKHHLMTRIAQGYHSQSTSWIDKQGHAEGTDTNLNRCCFDSASAQFACCHQSVLPPADKQSFTFQSQAVQCSVLFVVANTRIKSSTHHS